MLNLFRVWLVVTITVACVTTPKFALCLLCAGAALGCYTLLIIAVPRLRRPTAQLLAALARPHNVGKADQ